MEKGEVAGVGGDLSSLVIGEFLAIQDRREVFWTSFLSENILNYSINEFGVCQ